ncbi:MAG: alpha-ribazole phosphatase family protein [Propionivibrio sp.]
MQVFLIRHPQPVIGAGICYGRLDVDAHAPQAVAEHIKPRLPKDVPIYSSPLRRARQLAAALHPSPVIDARLSEIDFGDWEGRAWDDIERNALDAWAADVIGFTPPGGESVAGLQARVLDFAASLPALPAVALVTHAGVLRALFGHWRQLPAAEWTQLRFDYGSVTALHIEATL